ncbi:centromere protein Chl4/mis15/CENP-N [Dissophora ornata]|nr:centromere protein Chl4/mis15/CENP-N [Dissophora ornata]
MVGMDKELFPDTIALRRIVGHHSKDALIDFALRWINIHDITRIGGPALEEEDEDEQFNEFMLDDEDWNASIRRMSLTQYKAHAAKRYEGMREKGTKKKVADRMLTVDWSTGLNARQIAELDLAYYSEYPNFKNWKALKLNYTEGSSDGTRVDPSKIERTFSYFLTPYFKHHVQISDKKDMLWIRISIHDGLAPHVLPAPLSVVYFIWFRDSSYLLSSAMKVEWRDFVLEALLRLFKASEIEEWPLTGKYPSSLGELLLHKDSQGSHSQYRLNQIDENPLSNVHKKRKPEDLQDKYSRGMRDIRAEDITKIATRDRFVATEFGRNAQPRLERIDLQLNLPYTSEAKDFDLGRLTKQPFPIKVVLEGTNVIEGIKSLIPLGVAQNPMPKFLTELHSMATNSLTVDVDEEDASKQRISSKTAG